jgi:septal ring-binding cell division protein DamX
MITTVSGVQYWVREIPRNGYFIFRATINPRPWIDAWWKQVAGPFATSDDALASLS